MQRSSLQQCPQCGGAIASHHYTEQRYDTHVDRFLHCDHCDLVVECSDYHDGTRYRLDYHARTEPINYGKALARLEAASLA